jgi:hypothetical protein
MQEIKANDLQWNFGQGDIYPMSQNHNHAQETTEIANILYSPSSTTLCSLDYSTNQKLYFSIIRCCFESHFMRNVQSCIFKA